MKPVLSGVSFYQIKLPVLFLNRHIYANAPNTMLYSLLYSCCFMISFHPLHVSVTEIDYDEKDRALEIMMRVFIDDTELTFRELYKQPELDILNPKGGQTLDQMMRPYLAEHFTLVLDNKPQKINYLGHEKEGDVFILYLEVTGIKKWKTIQVKNDVIMETHEDQSNLVHVTVRGVVKSVRLTKSSPSERLVFEMK
jgi:hypothetical protein